MSRHGLHTHRGASVDRPFLRLLRRGLAALALLASPTAVLAFTPLCELDGPDDLTYEATPGEIVQIPFQVVRSSVNPSTPCVGMMGEVNTEATGTLVSVASPGGTDTSDPFTFQADEGQTVIVTYNAGTDVGSNSTVIVSCTSSACSGPGSSFNFNVVLVDRRLDPAGETELSNFEPGATVQLTVLAFNNSEPAGDVQIDWTVSGAPASPPSASTFTDGSGFSTHTLVLGTAMEGDNIVTVRAARSDAPADIVEFTVQVNTHVLDASSPESGTPVQGGSQVPLTVQYRINGSGAQNYTVTWSVEGGSPGTTLETEQSFTDSDGLATNLLTVGQPNLGEPIVVRATVTGGGAAALAKGTFGPGLPQVVFSFPAFDVLAMSGTSGDGQSAAVGTPIQNPLVVGVTRNGAPDDLRTVTWSVDPPGAAELSSTQTTLASGSTSVTVAEVLQAGSFTVTATHDDNPAATHVFTLAGTAPALALSITGGNNQSADIGQPFPTALSVAGTRNGSPDLTLANITWTVSPANAATLSASSTPLDSAGNASVTVQSVNAAGNFTVTAAYAEDPTAQAVFNGTGISPTFGASLTLVSGNNQSAPTGAQIPQPLVVQAFGGGNGAAQPNVPITWTVSPGGAAVVGTPNTTTDSNGLSQVTVTNGATGGSYTVTATRADAPGVSQVFTLTALQRDLVKPTDSGNAQAGATGSTLPNPLVVQATLNGAAEAGVGIAWSVVTAGGATLSNATSPTDNAGRSQVTVTLGTQTGPVVIRATRQDDTTIFEDYTVQAFSKTLVKPTTGSGDGQSGGVNSTLPQPLVAEARLNNAPEAGVTVLWTVQQGAAQISATNPTGADGRSSATVTLGAGAGTVVIRATRQDVPTQFQDYTLTALDVRTLDKPSDSGDGQSAVVGTTIANPLVVVARNNGTPTAGVQVLWTASNGATVTPATSVTDAAGRTSVMVTMGTSTGPVTVTATRGDASTATTSFVLTANAAPVIPSLTLEKPAGSGDGFAGPAGATVTLVARALRGGAPDANVDVFWDVVSGSASVGAAQSITGSDGVARTVVTLGNTPGDVVVRAQRGDQPSAVQLYTLRVQGGTSTELLEIVNGDNQTLAPDSLGAPLVVRYLRDGQVVGNATVRWEVLSGSARLGNASTTTAADGVSSNTVEAGSTLGTVFVRATAGTASTQFRLVVAQSTGLDFTLLSGNNQRGPAGTRADLPIVVQVTDGNGTPVAGRSIDWQVVSGGAVFDTPTTITDAAGRSENGFRFGPAPGPVLLRVSISGSQVHVLQVQATAVQATLSIVAGNNQTARAGTLLPQDLVVQVGLPAAGKALNGIVVRWEVTAGGGSLATATSTTDASGRASNKLTLGPSSGVQRVRASIDGASVEFTENATSDVGALVIVSGNNQTLPTRSPSAPLVVALTTTTGVPLQGAQLLWTPANAELQSVRTITDAQGRASNVAEVLLPGAATITVQVEGSSGGTVTFSINGGVANTPQLGEPEEDVANAVDSLCPALVNLANPTPAQLDLRARCLELVNNAGDNPGDVDDALEQLRQDVALAQANAAFVAARAQFDNLKTRIAALRSGSAGGTDFSGLAIANSSGTMPLSFLPSSVVQSEGEAEGGSMEGQELDSGFSKWGFFASGILGRGSYDGSRLTPEYDYDSNGLTAGVDYRANDQWILGAAVGWNTQDTDVAGDDSRVETDGWSVSGYGTWYHQNAWYFDGVLTFGSNDYDLARRIRYDIPGANGTTTVDQLARASTGGDQLSLALSFGRDFQRGNLSFGPYFRGMYTRVDFDGYEEVLSAGPGAGLGLAVEDRELTSMSAVVGGKLTWAISRDWGILMPHAQFEWEHEFEDDPQQLAARFLHDPTATRITAEGDAVDTDFYHVGFGLSALFANGRSAFLYYEHLAGSEGVSQDNLSLGVRIEF